MQRTRSRMIALAMLGASLNLSGCAWPEIMDTMTWQNQFRQQFTSLNPEDESVAQVDVATIVWRRDQPMVQEGLWAELDEQFLPLELRKQLARHGLRVGLMRSAIGTRLQAALANPEYARQSHTEAQDIIQERVILQDKVYSMTKAPVCTVEARRVMNRSEQELPWSVGSRGGQAKLLVPDAEKDYVVREVNQLELQFSIQMNKLEDGQTRIRLVPVVKCALGPDAGSNVFLDSLKLKNAINKLEQRYEKLAVEAILSHDQYLVVTATIADQHGADGETWGDLAFVNYPNDQQTVLVFRGASVVASRTPDVPKKGNAWPLAWQASELHNGTPLSTDSRKSR